MLTKDQLENFIRDGFIKIETAFSASLAEECRAILWKATGCDPNNPATWTQPVVRITSLNDEPFVQAANTAILHNAFDQLVGKNNWIPKTSMGSFPIRFPNAQQANDTGWHVDASFPGNDANNFLEWRINIFSKGRALLMLFLFSDVSEKDAATIIKVGSHLDVAKMLAPEKENGLSFMELAQKLEQLPQREIALATGTAGTVYLCHPFIVHAAQDHHGTKPKFMAQPALETKHAFDLDKPFTAMCAVEKAIVMGMNEQ